MSFEEKHIGAERYLMNNGVKQSIITDDPEKIFRYMQEFDKYIPAEGNILMFGAGAYTYAKHWANHFSGHMDVIEIEADLLKYAPATEMVNTYISDFNTWIRTNNRKYDVIINDAFNGDQAVYPESYKAIFRSLNPGGIYIQNVIQKPKELHMHEEVYQVKNTNNWIILIRR